MRKLSRHLAYLAILTTVAWIILQSYYATIFDAWAWVHLTDDRIHFHVNMYPPLTFSCHLTLFAPLVAVIAIWATVRRSCEKRRTQEAVYRRYLRYLGVEAVSHGADAVHVNMSRRF